jgi:hypothetical protein
MGWYKFCTQKGRTRDLEFHLASSAPKESSAKAHVPSEPRTMPMPRHEHGRSHCVVVVGELMGLISMPISREHELDTNCVSASKTDNNTGEAATPAPRRHAGRPAIRPWRPTGHRAGRLLRPWARGPWGAAWPRVPPRGPVQAHRARCGCLLVWCCCKRLPCQMPDTSCRSSSNMDHI